jgi:Domain of unknown function (DUF4404)
MTEQPDVSPETINRIRSDLHEVAQLLRGARHLEPGTQAALADLLDELRGELGSASLNSVHATQLAQVVAQLARALHENDTGPLSRAKSRIEEAIGRAEVESPVIAGVVRRFVDSLANIGI